MVRVGTAAFAHCALEVSQKVCLVARVGSQDGVPFGGASWGGQALVSLAPLLRPCPRLPLHHRRRLRRRACLQSPEDLCVRVRRHTTTH